VYAIDYLLKPIEAAQLERTLSKLERLHAQTANAAETGVQQTELQTVLAKLAEALNTSKSGYLQRIASRTGGRAQIIDVASITHFFAQDKLTFAATAAREQVYAVDYTITELEQRVNPQGFVRIHRSVLLNIDYIDEVHGWFAGRVMVRLKDTRRTELVVARDRVRVLKEVLGL
jgi:DNA-binding LytR/AlgR family response regulator